MGEGVRRGLADGGEEGGEAFVDPGSVFGGNGGFVDGELVAGGMVESKAPGVKHEAGWGTGLPLGLGVDGVAEESTTDVFHVDPDLVGAAGVEDAEDKGGVGLGVGAEGVVVSDRGTTGAGIDDGHFLARNGMATEVGEDRASRLGWDPLGDGEVELGGLPLGELAGERLLGLVGFGGDDAARGIFVEPMDDAGPLDAADAGELTLAMVEEGVDEGAIWISGGRVDDEADRLVDDDVLVVFVDDIKGDVLREDLGALGLWNADRDEIPFGDRLLGPGGGVVEEDVLRFEKRLDARPREVGELRREKNVQTLAKLVLDGDTHGLSLGSGSGGIKSEGRGEFRGWALFGLCRRGGVGRFWAQQ